MPDTGNAKDCLEFKKRDLISFTVQYRGIVFYFVLFV